MREKGASNRIFFLCVLCRGRSTTFVKIFILLLYFILFMIYYKYGKEGIYGYLTKVKVVVVAS
jgi:hypothetical protein